jgi:SAM-dependent MidA family methyltransferase
VLETSADLRQRQAATLAARAPRLAALVHWLDAPPRMPWRGALLANEVVDALPARLFEWRREVLVARAVTLGAGNELVWTTQPADAELRAAFEHVQSSLAESLTGPYRSELRPALPAWLAEVGGALAEGLMLFVDYGYPRGEYYLPERRDGTLVCHYRHRAHADPLILVGLQDLTAFVDFTALAEAGHAAGFELAGYCTQSAFLLASGLPAILEQSARAAPEQQARLAQQVKRLTLPGEMGERFQVMAFARKLDVDALPFAALDRSERL